VNNSIQNLTSLIPEQCKQQQGKIDKKLVPQTNYSKPVYKRNKGNFTSIKHKPAQEGGASATRVSDKGLSFIAGWEGSVRDSSGKHILYRDAVGVWTIGYGHAVFSKAERQKYLNGLTESEALTLFRQDIKRFEDGVRESLKVPVNQAQFDALVSLAYNIGIYAFKNSTVLRLINEGAPMSEIEEAWKRWVYGGGRVLPGLVNRRNAEWKLFSTGKYY